MAGEMFLSAVIDTLTEKATDFLLQEFTIELGVDRERQKLCSILPAVQAIVADAENRSRAEPAVRGWLHELTALAYEAEDVLDELRYDAISKEVETETRHEKKPRLFLLSNPGSSLVRDAVGSFSDGKRLKDVLEKIEAIVAEMNLFGFLKTQQPLTVAVNRPRRHSYVFSSTVIGRSEDLEKVVAIVLCQVENESTTVLPIVGMGGLGKTTFARLVYNNPMIGPHFQRKLWVCVSDEFDVARLAKAIIDTASGGNSQLPEDNVELIQQRLCEVLIGKRYLLVLDKVWNENPDRWRQLRLLLDCGAPGSVVIVTTRSQKLALIVGTMDAYHLQGLKKDDLLGIFRQKAFQMGVVERRELVDIGRQLMKKCCGSPLVATMLGGLMSYKKEEREWLDILKSKKLIGGNEIMPVLRLCYENLPSHMKRCFAFCAVYPKDFLMRRDTLIQLWSANSYIPLEEGIEIEATGKEIFNELAWRGFFHDTSRNYYDGVVCKMHDLIHDLAQSLVSKACISFSDSIQQSDDLSKEAFHVSSSGIKGIYGLLKECSYANTILSLSKEYTNDNSNGVVVDLSKAKSCRALKFSPSFHEIRVEPRTLKHLRYLDLSYGNLEVLPEAFCTSYNLQTLKLTWCKDLVRLPEGMKHMRSLRHVYLESCDKLNHMPAGLGKLRFLHMLTRYIVDPATGCSIEELKDLDLGGRLELHGLEKVGNQQEAKYANLVSKKRLTHLELWWGSSVDPDSARDVLEGLEPCRALQKIVIYNYNGIQFATWMHNSTTLRNLTRLKLNKCTQCTVLWPVWLQMPSLKVLELFDLKSLKHICSGSALLAQSQANGGGDGEALHMFPKLQKLELSGLKSLERWQENDQEEQTSLVLPQLSRLIVQNCPKLDALPSCPLLVSLYLINLDSLKHIFCRGSYLLDQGDSEVLPMFSKLEKIVLRDLPCLRRWHENDSTESTALALPRLEELFITKCPKMDALPSCPILSTLELEEVGLKHLCSSESALLAPIFPMLQNLSLFNMSSFERWQENDPAEQTSPTLPQLRQLYISKCPAFLCN